MGAILRVNWRINKRSHASRDNPRARAENVLPNIDGTGGHTRMMKWRTARVQKSAMACALIARRAVRTTQTRLLSSSAVLREEAPAHVGVAPTPRKPIGGIRGR